MTARSFSPEHRQILEEAFACKVFNQYAASEPSCFWCDCAYRIMHENLEYGISEILDAEGKPVSAGESGAVVVTFFLDTAMLFIRYRLTDEAHRGPDELCQCGPAMPRIQQVEGRLDDILYILERGYVGRLDPVFKGLSDIVETQIIQEVSNSIILLMVPDTNYNDSVGEHLITNLRSKLGNQVDISIQFVNQIPRSPNGKFRSVISKVKNRYPDNF